MLFIIRGELESSMTDGGRTNFLSSITLRSHQWRSWGEDDGELRQGSAAMIRPSEQRRISEE
jgi:hypothetical protein